MELTIEGLRLHPKTNQRRHTTRGVSPSPIPDESSASDHVEK